VDSASDAGRTVRSPSHSMSGLLWPRGQARFMTSSESGPGGLNRNRRRHPGRPSQVLRRGNGDFISICEVAVLGISPPSNFARIALHNRRYYTSMLGVAAVHVAVPQRKKCYVDTTDESGACGVGTPGRRLHLFRGVARLAPTAPLRVMRHGASRTHLRKSKRCAFAQGVRCLTKKVT
jgi:hypothetical protein